MMKVKLIQGDITKLDVDAVVNAANNTLLGGGGVDGAIHRAAGPMLLEACSKLNGCETGDAKITKGYHLPAKYIIHTVGPVWEDGNRDEASLLESCYRESLHLADQYGIRTIAFPNISTGVYGFPKAEAAQIAITTVKSYRSDRIEEVIFVCFDDENFNIYKQLLSL